MAEAEQLEHARVLCAKYLLGSFVRGAVGWPSVRLTLSDLPRGGATHLPTYLPAASYQGTRVRMYPPSSDKEICSPSLAKKSTTGPELPALLYYVP